MATPAEKRMKLSVAKATHAIRNKFKDLHNERKETTRFLEDAYKPITKKIHTLIDLNKNLGNKNNIGNVVASIKTGSKPKIKRNRNSKFKYGIDFDSSSSALKKDNVNDTLMTSEFYKPNDNAVDEFFETPKRIHADNYIAEDRSRVLKRTEPKIQEKTNNRIASVKRILDTDYAAIEEDEESPNLNKKKNKKTVKETRSLVHLDNIIQSTPLQLQKRLMRSQSTDVRGNGVINLTTKEFPNIGGSNSYIYWNDVNELVSRLRLLVSSTSTGHTGHNNEIVSIIEELREANVIE